MKTEKTSKAVSEKGPKVATKGLSKTVKVELSGGFHSVQPITVQIPREKLPTHRVGVSEFFEIFSDNQLDRLDKHFCGISDCSCGAYERATVHIEVSKDRWVGIADLPVSVD